MAKRNPLGVYFHGRGRDRGENGEPARRENLPAEDLMLLRYKQFARSVRLARRAHSPRLDCDCDPCDHLEHFLWVFGPMFGFVEGELYDPSPENARLALVKPAALVSEKGGAS